MKAILDFPECPKVADSAGIRVAIVYEDFASGTRAKHFAERLAEGLDRTCPLSESIWRSELLECPPIAAQAARAADDCDYLIVSLRGDRVLPMATRRWIEARLDGAAGRGTWLVALLGSDQGKQRVMDGNRHYLRCACAASGVAFFSHATTAAVDGAVAKSSRGDEAKYFELSERRWTPTLLDAGESQRSIV